MSFLLCPLCGKQTPLANFDPNRFELDVMSQQVVGLGKGKGFATSGRGSILGHNPTCEAIKNRILDLMQLFINERLVTPEELERLCLSTKNQLEVVRDETQAMKEEREGAYAKVRWIIKSIEEVTGTSVSYSFSDGEGLEGALGALSSAVETLADSYSARGEEAEVAVAKMQELVNDIETALESYGEFSIDADGGLYNATDQLKNSVERLLDELAAGGERDESDS